MIRRILAPLPILAFAFILPPTPAAALPADGEALAEDLAQWRKLDSRSARWRADSARLHRAIAARLKDGVLTSEDMTLLYRTAESYVRQRRRWQALLDCQGDEAWDRMGPELKFNAAGRTQAKLALAAALEQHDDYLLGVHPWFQEGKSRRLLKSDHPEVDGELDSAVRHFLNPVLRLRLARAVAWHREVGAKVADRTPDEVFLDERIGRSPGYAFFSNGLVKRISEEWKTGGHAALTFVTDHVTGFGDRAEATASMAVGNTVGLVATRQGRLASMGESERRRLGASLKPLDLLLEKTPFRLTDKSIPGHYGHVAVWAGTESDLKALGVWDDPLVRPHQEHIRAGAGVIEALRPGVEINTLEHFLNIDDLLVLRPATMKKEKAREAVLRAFAQLGKSYDFNFNVESDRRIVCSELAYVVFPAVPWRTSPVMGRRSITPDQVASTAVAAGLFRPVGLWHDGVEIDGRLAESLTCLLNENEAAFRRLHPGFRGAAESR